MRGRTSKGRRAKRIPSSPLSSAVEMAADAAADAPRLDFFVAAAGFAFAGARLRLDAAAEDEEEEEEEEEEEAAGSAFFAAVPYFRESGTLSFSSASESARRTPSHEKQ
jgi:hypothetical protein